MKLALIVALVVASSASMLAQKKQIAPEPNNLPAMQIPARLTPADIVLPNSASKQEEETQAATFRRIFSTDVRSQFHYWPFNTASGDILKYDPKSRTLNLARNRAIIATNITGVDIGIMRSTNGGRAWTFDIVKNTSDIFFGMPNFGWVNPDDVSDASKYATAIYGIRYPIPALSYGGMSLWNRTTNGVYELPLSDQTAPGPGYDVQMGDLYADNVLGALHYAGTLNTSAGAQYGAYGYFNFNLVVEDYGTAPTIPSAWALDKWIASDVPSSSFNAPVLISGDDEGTLYSCFNNIQAESEPGQRSIQVSKSTDNGKTWGALNAMPRELLSEYATARGGDIGFQPGQSPYQGGAFIVTGKDSYSFFFRYLYGLASQTQQGALDSILGYQIVEAAYKNGTWKLNEVANLNTITIDAFSIQDSVSQSIGAVAIVGNENGRGHEVQVAKTADGQNLVVKYIDINPDRQNTFAAVRRFSASGSNYTEGEAYTSNFDTDIFVTSRPIGSSEWTQAVNCTDDADMSIRTYMPDVVPSLDSIPVVRMIGTNANAAATLPRQVFQLVWNGTAAIDFSMLNPLATSVESEERTYDFRFNNVAPNPVNSMAEVTFTLDRPAMTTIEVYDIIGNKIASVYSQFLNAGLQGVNVDASQFAPGTYNIALVVDGQRTMKSFVVVR
ncbi:MAG: hypothetical protein FGM33_07115 [Candidatus Kapabacteria bacterium]|nr:hypothetical protein [Candidatus Kapabacteria bacterium]